MPDLIAFIGTRAITDVESEWVQLFNRAAVACASWGYTMVTGAAVGADQLAADIVLQTGGKIELKLPWRKYEKEWVDSRMAGYPGQITLEVYSYEEHSHWHASVQKFHPAPQKLTNSGLALHARNFGIIEAAKTIVALPHPRRSGGTDQGLRIAEALRRRVYNLTLAEDREELHLRMVGSANRAKATGQQVLELAEV